MEKSPASGPNSNVLLSPSGRVRVSPSPLFRGVVSLQDEQDINDNGESGNQQGIALTMLSPPPISSSGNSSAIKNETPLRSNTSHKSGPRAKLETASNDNQLTNSSFSWRSVTTSSIDSTASSRNTDDKNKDSKPSLRKRNRRRRSSKDYSSKSSSRRRRKNGSKKTSVETSPPGLCQRIFCGCWFCRDRTFVRSTLSCMNLMAKVLFWCSAVASVMAVVWYSNELTKHGTDPHLIAWFSAGAFVLLGFPISMYGIVTHLANYNQPNVQMYVVRILWMVPIYSIESWLCLRYKDYAIYIETLRDCYESYVLYSFLQFLIEVLGGEDALILMLKDKSPTRGVHMWGLQWCVKPWLMGQPVRKTYESMASNGANNRAGVAISSGTSTKAQGAASAAGGQKPLKRVHWTSPFFVKCKFGVLQYVLLKFVCSIVVMILERNNIYKEGDFTPRGGYLYICILTNLSQCWALYCLIFFYYATKNELGSIRPVGKFLSVKALVFFTWWQSVMISILYQMDLIPHYQEGRIFMGNAWDGISGDDDISDDGESDASLAAAAKAVGNATMQLLSTAAPGGEMTTQEEWSAEDVAKGMQDYLICIEMFLAAIVHIFVFPHTEYDAQAVEARTRALNQTPHKDWNKRLGRKWKEWDNKSGWSGTTYTSGDDIELNNFPPTHGSGGNSFEDDDLRIHPMDRLQEHKSTSQNDYTDEDEDETDEEQGDRERKPLLGSIPSEGEDVSMGSIESSELLDEDSYQDLEEGDDEDEDDFEDSAYFDEEQEEENAEGLGNPSVLSQASAATPAKAHPRKPGFVKALLDSAIPQDLRDNTVGIIKGDYVVEKKTLLHHAATSDSYDLFSRVSNRPRRPQSSFK